MRDQDAGEPRDERRLAVRRLQHLRTSSSAQFTPLAGLHSFTAAAFTIEGGAGDFGRVEGGGGFDGGGGDGGGGGP